MADSKHVLEIVARVRDNATAPLRKTEGALKKTGTAADKAGKKVKGYRTELKTIGQAAAVVGTVLTALTYKLAQSGIAFGKTLSAAAANAEETQSKFDTLFKSVSKEAGKSAKDLAKGMGRGTAAIQESMASIQNLLTPMGLVGEEGLQISETMSALAIDLASFNNAADDEALLALRSALIGESEPMRRFGVTLSDAKLQQEALNLALTAGTKALTDRE